MLHVHNFIITHKFIINIAVACCMLHTSCYYQKCPSPNGLVGGSICKLWWACGGGVSTTRLDSTTSRLMTYDSADDCDNIPAAPVSRCVCVCVCDRDSDSVTCVTLCVATITVHRRPPRHCWHWHWHQGHQGNQSGATRRRGPGGRAMAV
jgi:hypothetical protein